MANDLVRVEFGSANKPNDQIVYKDLNAQAANIIGTAYKGPAFVPQVMFNSSSLNDVDVRNTFINLLGSHRQNMHNHLYDEYSCYTDSDAYDATSMWFGNGGEYAYFTRVLGIGTGIKNEETGKMIGSGFNLSKNISSGTLDHKTSRYLNANDGGDPGCIGFVVRSITENGKSPEPTNSNPSSYLDYFYELGITDSANILTDTIMFASGVLPDLTNNNSNTFFDATSKNFSDIDSNYQTSFQTNHYVNLRNFNPYFAPLSQIDGHDNPQGVDVPNRVIEIKENNNLFKAETYTNFSINQFAERFFEKSCLKYSSYPFCGFNKNTLQSSVGILVSRDYETTFNAEEKLVTPDYNSFECHYQTAKTPWITSQPLTRPGSWTPAASTNRTGIHKEVENLFRFWSLDDGEVGNRFRIKINIKQRGDTSVSEEIDDSQYATFDLYIFEYDPRINDYLDMKVPDTIVDNALSRSKGPVETHKDLNLNPDSEKYIGRVIGTEHTYYDFDADKLVTKGKYKNRSDYLRVEMAGKVENSDYTLQNKQHTLLPTGFRSYPHIELKKSAFKHYADPNTHNINLVNMFDTSKIYQLPPQYALNYYKDEALKDDSGIDNNWGVIFTPSSVIPIDVTPDELQYCLSRHPAEGSVDNKDMSPHFYYSKYFLSGINQKNSDGETIHSSLTFVESASDGDQIKIYVRNQSGVEKYITFTFKPDEEEDYTRAEATLGYKKVSGSEYTIIFGSTLNDKPQQQNLKSAFYTYESDIKTYYGYNSLFRLDLVDNTITLVQANNELRAYAITANTTDINIKNSSEKNVWVEEDNYLNSFFHLEKIAFKNETNPDGVLINVFDASAEQENFNVKNIVYKHSGSSIEATTKYQYLSLESDSIIWDADRALSDKFNNKLSFDFFAYGGFDGVDIRDSDKRNLRNDSIIRELYDVGEVKSTYISYDKAIDIAVDSANTETDILIVPGIKEIPLIRKCINICEDSRTQFFIGDISGVCSNTLINYTNQTTLLSGNPAAVPPTAVYADTLIKTSLGVMGKHIIVENTLSDYTRDENNLRLVDDRFMLTNIGIPSTFDVLRYYSYEQAVKDQFSNIISLYPTYSIQSKYFFPVLGDLNCSFANESFSFEKKVCPEVFVLGQIAAAGISSRNNLTLASAPRFLEFEPSLSLINIAHSTNAESFESDSKRLKEAGINIIYRNTEPTDTIKLLSQNTAYEIRGSLFKDQGVVRTIQQIKKRIMYNLFLDSSLIAGGFFFAQNANLNNLYDKLDIQLKNILNRFVQEGLINDFKVKIPRREDDRTLLDMQNYILRGSIILQMNISDTIDLTIDSILGDLSLLADPALDSVLLPELP